MDSSDWQMSQTIYTLMHDASITIDHEACNGNVPSQFLVMTMEWVWKE